MAIEVKYSSQISKDTGVKILVYSDAGMGKTVLAFSLPKPVLISAESGLLSTTKENLARIYGPTGLPYVDDMITIEVSTFEQLEEAYQWCVHPDTQSYFESIAIDSITEIAER